MISGEETGTQKVRDPTVVLIMLEDLKLSSTPRYWASSDVKPASQFDRIFTDRMWHLNIFYLLTQAELMIN